MIFIAYLVTVVIFFSLLMNKKHFLMTLLMLEALMVIFLFVFYLELTSLNTHLFLIFITISACEGALGLSILVNLSRNYSSDYLLMLSTIIYGSV